jgi:hypothetical protein
MLKTGTLRDALAGVIGEDAARPLLRQLIGFAIGVRRESFSADIVASITEAMRERE